MSLAMTLTEAEARSLAYALEHLHEPAPVPLAAMGSFISARIKLSRAMEEAKRPRLAPPPAAPPADPDPDAVAGTG